MLATRGEDSGYGLDVRDWRSRMSECGWWEKLGSTICILLTQRYFNLACYTIDGNSTGNQLGGTLAMD